MKNQEAAQRNVQLSVQRKVNIVKPLYHSSQKPARKPAASAFKYCDWMKVLTASLRVGFCDEWKGPLVALKLDQVDCQDGNILNP